MGHGAGRALLGIGLGFSSLRTIGMGPARIAAMESSIPQVRALWRGEGEERAFVHRLRQEYDPTRHASPSSPHSAGVPASLIERYAVAGTPEDFHAQLARLLAQPGIDRVILNPQVARPDALPVDALLRGRACDVLPHVTFSS